jgi:hypothetical protein
MENESKVNLFMKEHGLTGLESEIEIGFDNMNAHEALR